MSSKALTAKRIVIFCVIAFVPFWVIVPIMNATYGGMIYESEAASGAVYALGVFGMLTPALANLLTRMVTKEGFADSYLGLNFKGNAKYYAASVWVKLAEVALCCLLVWMIFGGGLGFSEAFPFDNMNTRAGAFLFQLSAAIIIFFPAFGEEWGWRGYLMPKLTKIMGRPAAVVVGGVIWGLWHAPLTISGHNFGTDYDLYPWLGILLMCVMCILMNAFLTLLTEKTGSVYPACFCHMVNNSFGADTFAAITGSDAFADRVSGLSTVSVMLKAYLPLLAVTGVISFVLLIKNKDTASSP